MAPVHEDHLFLIGISHKTADVELREQFSFGGETVGAVLERLRVIAGVRECLVLSTCNRTEVYAVVDDGEDDAAGNIGAFLEGHTPEGISITDSFYRLTGTGVIGHLFRVVSGLDSMILGEPQIFGQVKEAYATACDRECTGPLLNRLFHHAFQVGKRIRNSTSVGEGAVSVSHAAIELAKRELGDLDGRSVLLVGAGKIGELCARGIINAGVTGLRIANRTVARSSDLANRLSGEVITFGGIAEESRKADIVITSVAACEPVITADMLRPFTGERSAPLLLIDLGVPRNIHPDTASLPNTKLYNIDDLSGIIDGNRDRREQEALKAEAIIRGEVDSYRTWLRERAVIPLIKELNTRCEIIRREEIERVRNRVDDATMDIIDQVSRRIVRKILHHPVITMRAAACGDARERLIESINELLNSGNDE